MRNVVLGLLLASGTVASSAALADNPLTTDQLMRAAQLCVKATQDADPSMANSISGFRTVTVGKSVQVVVDSKADGMNMSAKYLCVPQGPDMTCRVQQ